MKILITGGFGYVGSKIVESLSRDNYSLFIIDNLIHKTRPKLKNKNLKFFQLDINNYKKLNQFFKNKKFDIVIHLAAIVGDPASKKFPELTLQTNLYSSKKLFKLCVLNKVKKFIFFSTCSNYGLSKSNKLLSETSKLKPLSLYAKTKVDFEKYLLKNSDNIQKIILRISTLYGSSPRMRYDLTINEFTKYLFLKKKLKVFDIDSWRPYLHLSDLCKIVNHFINDKNQKIVRVYNAGINNENYTKKNICEEILNQIKDRKKYVEYIDKASKDKRNYKVDFRKIKNLNIKNNFNVKKGIKEMIRNLKKNNQLKKFLKIYSNV